MSPMQLVNYDTADLTTFPGNPRRGDVQSIAESLIRNKQYRPIVVNIGTLTGRPLEVLAGNHTLMAARELGWTKLLATTVDVDDDQCRRIVAVDNRMGELGSEDTEDLLALLQSLDDLTGTGYTEDYVDGLLSDLGGDPLPPMLEPEMDFGKGDRPPAMQCQIGDRIFLITAAESDAFQAAFDDWIREHESADGFGAHLVNGLRL